MSGTGARARSVAAAAVAGPASSSFPLCDSDADHGRAVVRCKFCELLCSACDTAAHSVPLNAQHMRVTMCKTPSGCHHEAVWSCMVCVPPDQLCDACSSQVHGFGAMRRHQLEPLSPSMLRGAADVQRCDIPASSALGANRVSRASVEGHFLSDPIFFA